MGVQTGHITPFEQMYCLRQCAYVFFIQNAICIYFMLEKLGYDNFSIADQTFDIYNSILRVVCGTLL